MKRLKDLPKQIWEYWADFFRKQTKFILYGKLIIFGFLVVMSVVALAESFDTLSWIPILGAEVILLLENAIKMFRLHSFKQKEVCYVIDVICLVVMMCFAGGISMSSMFLIILTEFYTSSPRLRDTMVMFAVVLLIYIVASLACGFTFWNIDAAQLTSQILNDTLYFIFHFFAINFIVFNYRNNLSMQEKNREIDKKNKELKDKNKALDEANRMLNERNGQLEQANKELVRGRAAIEEVIKLKEQERISLSIHNNAGHTMTIVIMQTEAARVALQNGRYEDALSMIVSANFNAKKTMEAIRQTVHGTNTTSINNLQTEIATIVDNVTVGGHIKFRTDVDQIFVSQEMGAAISSIVQEGISNGIRHGKANAFYLEIKQRKKGEVDILLSDNGCGADIELLREGYGIQGLRKMCERFHGQFSFYSEPEEGFEIHITLPLTEQEGDSMGGKNGSN